MIIRVKVKPNSSKEEIVKIGEKEYFVSLKEKAVDGKANKQLVRVLSNGDKFNSENFNEELIMSRAGLDEGVFNEGIFYFKLDVVRESGVESISRGNPDFEIQCELEGKGFAKCYEASLVLFDNGEEVTLYVFTGSNTA